MFKIFWVIKISTLFVLLEGPDDERFFHTVIEPKLKEKYDQIKFYLYSGRPKKQRENYIKTLIHGNKNYVVIADFNSSTCMTDKKQWFQQQMIRNVQDSKIFIAKIMIESWYLSGLDYSASTLLQIPYHPNTESISKTEFEEMIPTNFSSRIDFMNEILKKFNLDVALKQNNSFEYFFQRCIA